MSPPPCGDIKAIAKADLSSPTEEHFDEQQWRKKVEAAKQLIRTELSVAGGDWRRQGHADSEVLSTTGIDDKLPRIHWRNLSVAAFEKLYEEKGQPVVITGLCEDWPATGLWTEEKLLRDFGEHRFKVGSDDDGYAVRLRFKYFLQYMYDGVERKDDSPLYIFDGSFAEKHGSKALKQDYSIPMYFKEDLMQYGGESRRPPYRWFVMGPARSGSYIHVDPLATSAWNSVLQGCKRWALFPPNTQRASLQPKGPGLEREAVSWFRHVYPLTQAPEWPGARPIDILQAPGETVFVPGGWWHTVMNLETPTIAITHNYASSPIFEKVWLHARRSRPKFSRKWLETLRTKQPHLAELADRAAHEKPAAITSSSSSDSSSSSSSSSDSSSSGSSCDSKRKIECEAVLRNEASTDPSLDATEAKRRRLNPGDSCQPMERGHAHAQHMKNDPQNFRCLA